MTDRPSGEVPHTHIGGQAVLEGIMMRGKLNWAIAVRQPDGSIHVESHKLVSAAAKHGWMRWPIVRGVVTLFESLSLGLKAFSISAQHAGDSEEEQLTSKEVSLSLFLGAGLAILIFIVGPAFLTNLMVGPAIARPFVWNLVDGLLRVVAFFLYIWAITWSSDIRRVFAYHGAEHKTIHAFEHKIPLEPKSIQQFSTAHVRCGTSFLLMVMFVALIVFSLTPIRAFAASLGIGGNKLAVLGLSIAIRLLLLPVIAGLAYEVIRFAGNHSANPIVRILLWPGLMLQKMTTREPEDDMIEIAVAAVVPVLEAENLMEGVIVPESVMESISGRESADESGVDASDHAVTGEVPTLEA